MPTQAAVTQNANRSDADLAAAIRGGDEQAFTLLMRRMNRPLYRTARSILRDDAEAEDALQDAYLQAYRGIASWRGDASLKTWLTRIVVNEAIARSRKSKRRATVIQLQGQAADDMEEAEMEQTAGEQPEQAVLRSQMRAVLEKSIDGLPENFRTVFMLRAVEEMGVEEVAACLDIPEATVRSRFFRARALLRQALESQIDFATGDAFGFDGARCDRIVTAVIRRLRAEPE
ncbi:RNA polymerase sigma factor [Noviherbaspirillum pedocola]|uniref:RNA polymerase sigma factor n=1 Tax=Noviherbaspirillum pedocola TaxID=2801341 RepID=A0A934W9I2_9BURK|nr:RNA polymerase sigma factor [Noviherbaspirillum pedocola]MBK4738940.1 RNA polymerase sigma factor [Noviherbaspirillum pedocola]